MGAFEARSALRVPGRLALDCTDLALAWPHGGVGLGKVADVILEPVGHPYPVTDEARGFAAIGFLEHSGAWKATAIAQGWDVDAVAAAFADGAPGAVSQRGAVLGGTTPAGTDRTGDARVLVFTPEGGEQALDPSRPEPRAPFWFLRRAFCALQESAALRFGWDDVFGVPVVFYSLHDASGLTLQGGQRGDVSL